MTDYVSFASQLAADYHAICDGLARLIAHFYHVDALAFGWGYSWGCLRPGLGNNGQFQSVEVCRGCKIILPPQPFPHPTATAPE